MRAQIEGVLKKLQDLPMLESGRNVDLQSFQFGPIRKVSDRHGEIRMVGTYALHVQCAWRITCGNEIVVASRDRFYPAGDSYQEVENFEWDKPGANRCDERISKMFQNRSGSPFIVKNIISDDFGGFSLSFDSEYTLTVFPDDSLEGEFWRFFEPFSNQEHFIITGKGIQIE